MPDSISTRPNGKMFDYAFCGTYEFFNNKLQTLVAMAESEPWTTPGSLRQNDRIRNYIIKTFERCFDLLYIVTSDCGRYSLFNTGLLTINGEEIYGHFEKNDRFESTTGEEVQKWKFLEFLKASDRKVVGAFSSFPSLAFYGTRDDLHFDIDKDIITNIDHIIDYWDDNDDENDSSSERFPAKVKRMGKEVVLLLIKSSLETAKIKIKRNPRLVVPQFYHNTIMYLIPITIPLLDGENYTYALAVEKTNTGLYRVNTILPIEWAYKKARLVMKPESSWLLK